MSFTILVTEDQRTHCNSYLHTPDAYCWLDGTTNKYEDIIDFTVVAVHCISYLRDAGWNTHRVDEYNNPEPLTLDLTQITEKI